MRFLIAIPIFFMIALGGYAIWDLKVDSFQPAIPVDQLAVKNDEISQIVAPYRIALMTEMSGTVLPQIDDSLDVIKEEYGEVSTEHNQSLIEVALLLYENKRPDLGKAYMERAVKVSRLVYGNDHRETALTLHDLANMYTDAANADFSEESINLLRQSLEIRQKVLPDDHLERIASEVSLADQLFLQWQAEGTPEDTTQLDEAAALLKHAVSVQEKTAPVNDMNRVATGLLYARIAFYKEDFATAATYFGKTLSPVTATTDPATYVVFNNAYSEHVVALRRIGKDAEADKMQKDIIAFIRQASQQGAQNESTSTPTE